MRSESKCESNAARLVAERARVIDMKAEVRMRHGRALRTDGCCPAIMSDAFKRRLPDLAVTAAAAEKFISMIDRCSAEGVRVITLDVFFLHFFHGRLIVTGEAKIECCARPRADMGAGSP